MRSFQEFETRFELEACVGRFLRESRGARTQDDHLDDRHAPALLLILLKRLHVHCRQKSSSSYKFERLPVEVYIPDHLYASR